MTKPRRRRVTETDVARAVDRIVLTWYRCDARDVPTGWYLSTRLDIDRRLRPSTVARLPGRWTEESGGLDLACSVAAVLAPRARWERVLDILPGVMKGRRPGGLKRSLNAAGRLIAGVPFEDVVSPRTSPKTTDFRAALLGDPCSPVVDVWSGRVAGIDPSTVARYRAARRAYVLAGEELGVDPSEVQARTWAGVRSGAVPLPR